VTEGSKKKGTYRTREVEIDENSKEWRDEHGFEWESQYRGELLIVKGASGLGLFTQRPISLASFMLGLIMKNAARFQCHHACSASQCCAPPSDPDRASKQPDGL
jgi:hypothetical protein